MNSRYAEFDRNALDIRPLAERNSDMHLDDVLAVGQRPVPFAPFSTVTWPQASQYHFCSFFLGRPGVPDTSRRSR